MNKFVEGLRAKVYVSFTYLRERDRQTSQPAVHLRFLVSLCEDNSIVEKCRSHSSGAVGFRQPQKLRRKVNLKPFILHCKVNESRNQFTSESLKGFNLMIAIFLSDFGGEWLSMISCRFTDCSNLAMWDNSSATLTGPPAAVTSGIAGSNLEPIHWLTIGVKKDSNRTEAMITWNED